MEYLIFEGYEFLASFIPFLITMLLFRHLQKRKGIRIAAVYNVAVIVLAFYVIAVFHFTGAGTLYNAFTFQTEIRYKQFNLIPFSNDIDPVGYLLNVLLFVPFGIIVPFIWQKKADFTYTAGTAFLFSLLIEVSQMLNIRSPDIDDLLLNTLGAMIGFILYQLLMKATKIRFRLQPIPCIELPVYIAVMFIGRLLLFNEMGMAKLLYGF